MMSQCGDKVRLPIHVEARGQGNVEDMKKILVVVFLTCTFAALLGVLATIILLGGLPPSRRVYLVGAGIPVGLALLFMFLGESIGEDLAKGFVISVLGIFLYFRGVPGMVSLTPIVGVAIGTVGNSIVRSVSNGVS